MVIRHNTAFTLRCFIDLACGPLNPEFELVLVRTVGDGVWRTTICIFIAAQVYSSNILNVLFLFRHNWNTVPLYPVPTYSLKSLQQ